MPFYKWLGGIGVLVDPMIPFGGSTRRNGDSGLKVVFVSSNK